MSGRRAKQRRRLVWLAECGDQAAQTWCMDHLTFGELQRESRRHVERSARRAGRGRAA